MADPSFAAPITVTGDVATLPLGSQLVTAIQGRPVSGAAPTAGQGFFWDSSSKQWLPKYPSGYELNYKQITSAVTGISTTESTSTTVVTFDAVTFDGSPVMVEFFAPYFAPGNSVGSTIVVSVFEGSTQLGRLTEAQTDSTSALRFPCFGRYRFTPSSASHTYSIKVFVSVSSTGALVQAGSGGTGAELPAYGRITKV